MNILILSQAKDVFLHLVLNNKDIEKLYLANYSFADKIYYNNLFKKYNINFKNIIYNKYTDDELNIVYNKVEELYKTSIDYQRLDDKENIKNIVLRYCNLYLNFDNFFKTTTIDVTVTWNGYFAPDIIVNYLAKKYNIKTIYYEMGLFRPNTMTIDNKAVNFGNSVPQDINYFKENRFSDKNYKISTKSNIDSSSKNIYKLYKVFDHLLYHLNIYTYKRFDNNIKKLNIKKQKELSKTYQLSDIDNQYINIFVPLQVSTDTQILLNSPEIKSMDRFIEILNNKIITLNKKDIKYKIYIKKHPKDLKDINIKFEDNIYLLDESIKSKDIIKKTNLTLTINSTVGLEAIELHKSCVVLGNAFYSIEPIAFKANIDNLIFKIEESLQKTDTNLQTNFINYLKYNYQLSYNPFNILEYDNSLHIKKFKELMR